MNTLLKTSFGAMVLALSACAGSSSHNGSNADAKTYWVNSSKVQCMGVGKMQCLQVSNSDELKDAEWRMFYDAIEGFTFEPGIFQKIQVTEEHLDPAIVPADASSIKYILVKVMNKQEDLSMKLIGSWTVLTIRDLGTGKPSMIETPGGAGGTIPSVNFKLGELGSMEFYGSDGCNNFTGVVSTSTDTALTLGPAASTRKMCRNMQTPNAINAAMSKVAGYSIDDQTLSLKDETGQELMKLQKTN